EMAMLGILNLAAMVSAPLLIVSTMRPFNDYRGLHELASGTHTYRLRAPEAPRRRAGPARTATLDVSRPEGMPERVGPFRVTAAVRWTPSARVLVGEDPQLGRRVWLWLRPVAAASAAVRRDVGRLTRARWVNGGTHDGWAWDAFLAPAGVPL